MAEPLDLEHAIEQQPDLLEREGLHEVLVGPRLDRLDRLGNGRVRRHQDHGRVGATAADLPQQGEPVHVRHADVRDDEIEPVLREGRERLPRIPGPLRPVPEATHVAGEVIADVLRVVDDQDARHERPQRCGSSSVKQLPRPT